MNDENTWSDRIVLAVMMAFFATGIAAFLVIIFAWALPPKSYVKVSVVENVLEGELDSGGYIGACTDETLLSTLYVYVGEIKEDNIQGQFYTNILTIALENTGVATIAHEVSHFVDRTLLLKHIKDGETRAYLQGFFTECVYDLVRSNGEGHDYLYLN